MKYLRKFVSDFSSSASTQGGVELQPDGGSVTDSGMSQSPLVPVIELRNPEQVDYVGKFIEYSNNSLLGWVASIDGSSIDHPLELTINGKKTRNKPSIFKNIDSTFSVTLPPGGFCFEVKIENGELDSESDENMHLALSVKVKTKYRTNRVVAVERSLKLLNNTIFNKNPLLISNSSCEIPQWKIPNADLLGIRIGRFSAPCSDSIIENSGVARSFTRIALTGNMSSVGGLALSTQIDVLESDSSEQLELALRARTDRPTDVACKLVRNGDTVSTINILVDSYWCEFRLIFEDSQNNPRFRRDKYEVVLDWSHSGRGYVDIAACALGVAPSLRSLFLEEYAHVPVPKNSETATEEIKGITDYISNGDFSRWSNGIMFDSLLPRQELADGWRLECRKDDCSNVSVMLEKRPNDSESEQMNQDGRYGMKVNAGEFSGIMRVTTFLHRDYLNQAGLKLLVNAHGCGDSTRKNVVNRIVIVGRGNGQEKVLHVIARKQRVRKQCELTFEIAEESIVKIRRNAPKRSSFFLGIEVEKNSEIMFTRVSLKKCIAENTTRNSVSQNIYGLDELVFEDSSISEQAVHLKGLNTWTGPLHEVTGDQCRRSGIEPRVANNLYGYLQPTMHRPERGFPSVDVVVPIYNAVDVVKDCIRSVVECTAVPYTLICVDDGSDSETRDWLDGLAATFPQVNVLRNEENLGYTRTVNRGISASTADWVCVLNSDCIVTSNWLEYLVEVAMTDDAIGIVSPLSNAASYQSIPHVRQRTGEWHFNPLPANTTPEDMAILVREHSLAAYPKAEIANGFCQLIRRSMLDSIGMLDEKTFPRGFGEENDLCARAILDDWQIRIADDTYVYHVKSQSFGHIERKSLSKVGTTALKNKHPDIDWNDVTKRLEAHPALMELRKRIADLGF